MENPKRARLRIDLAAVGISYPTPLDQARLERGDIILQGL